MSSLASMDPVQIALRLGQVVVVILSIMLHEVGHGYAALKMGDTTAKDAGRLTLNPIKHVDLFGSVILPLMLSFSGGPIIGYAKPVPYNPNRLRDKKKGEVIVGLAGPATNLVLTLVFAGLAYVVYHVIGITSYSSPAYYAWIICYMFVQVNLCLMFFNLIPLPPLDGSSIVAPFLSNKALAKYYQVQHYALPILLVVMIVIPWITGIDIIGIYLNATAGNLSNLLLGM